MRHTGKGLYTEKLALGVWFFVWRSEPGVWNYGLCSHAQIVTPKPAEILGHETTKRHALNRVVTAWGAVRSALELGPTYCEFDFGVDSLVNSCWMMTIYANEFYCMDSYLAFCDLLDEFAYLHDAWVDSSDGIDLCLQWLAA